MNNWNRIGWMLLGVLSVAALAWVGSCAAGDGDDDGDDTTVTPPPPPPAPVFVGPDVNDPLSAIVAVRFTGVPAGFPVGSAPANLPAGANIADYVKALVAHANANFNFANNTWPAATIPAGFAFPLANANTDASRQIGGMTHDIVVKWLDPITNSTALDAPRFGANADYNAFFGDNWNSNANGWTGGPNGVLGNAPQWSGSGDAGYLWTNFEYISGAMPGLTNAPTDSHLIFAKCLQASGILTNNVASNTWTQADVDTYIRWYKKELGGAYVRIMKDAGGKWVVDKSGTHNRRFDATSNTLARFTGYTMSGPEVDDAGANLPAGVVVGIAGDCSGGQAPWGTIFTAEENIQDYYGDLESCWNGAQRFTTGQGYDAGAAVTPPFTVPAAGSGEFGQSSELAQRKRRDAYGWVVEIDPEQAASKAYASDADGGDGLGHRKMGTFGRFRWENMTFVTGTDFKLIPNQPIVAYGADDRRGGRIFKYVSNANYVPTMNRAQVRALLDDGKLYVANFTDLHNDQGRTVGNATTRGGVTITVGGNAVVPTQANPGNGVFIELSVNNTTTPAPNAGAAVPAGHSLIAAANLPNLTVGAALADNSYNGIGGFATDDLVRAACFTAAAKIGVKELNRPEDLEWNPFGWAGGTGTEPRLYIAFTNHNSRTCCDLNGVLLDPADDHGASAARNDNDGRVWVLSYGGANPATNHTFTFWQVAGSNAPLLPNNVFDFADPDNIAIDKDGGVWFGTDGYFGSADAIGAGRSDAIYYLDTNPANVNSLGRPFRVIAGPSNAEATGPCFTPDMKTMFYAAQHPGEQPGPASTFPQPR